MIAGLLFAAIAGTVCLGTILVVAALGFSDMSAENVSRASLEQVARMRLPASARDVRSHVEGFQDQLVYARFAFREADLPQFAASLRCTLGPVASAAIARTSNLEPAWWSRSAITTYRNCDGEGPGFSQTVVIDVARAPDLVAYVSVFER